MKFTVNLTALLFAALSSAMAAKAAPPVARAPDAMSIIFFDDTFLTGDSYSPANSGPDVCITLASNWRNRAESLVIASGYSCAFHAFTNCQGTARTLSGTINQLPQTGNPVLYQNIESFECTKLG
ncbi:hypothetical protein JR316_0009357 [Psilocybe cubensis]|uniref:Uncharacterized protein n=2 Tax=Psilocybe cubensis TaxID=181762 RepID=A0A8H8CKX8_PSICU|nr:hypothetical protein JR316_0009357 [Psilocybe cubensis]KAH9478895.1 hypothetical protein JR316_0009357 [Psilocybe cubensis]